MAEADHGSHAADPDEPKTPMWLPALGVLFFLIAGIWIATRPSSEPSSADAANGNAAPSASANGAAAAPAPSAAAR